MQWLGNDGNHLRINLRFVASTVKSAAADCPEIRHKVIVCGRGLFDGGILRVNPSRQRLSCACHGRPCDRSLE